ncbi:HpcH/HpaI aldolase family protein [Aureimonas jatrophae]|uniref:4-hydroxy-2-oxoheptanedioate aldolase n=1 Tax=Aureimonas jatrophae TaxID=1166073 RepID=A0A1H0JJ56_9HYPH|nr:aldolase/citrate lyase family protein [Aureimonas jatrophae]MBB3951378.1 4-hydroxy-2-oxoheptanedioate aldolase [Aureimonas jatrophae]SDO43746.1 4-hydroxy-2-oxoheptanedioate aldolase [Aureimonas jatrophae]
MSDSLLTLRRLLDREGSALSAWSSLGDPTVHEVLARTFDAVTLDVQHGLQSVDEIRDGIARVVLAGRPVLVRVPVDDLSLAARALDFGAHGVILPMVEGAEDARRFARALSYPPRGQRSYGPARAADLHQMPSGPDYMRAAHDAIMTFAMIETPAALAAIDDILAVEELHGVFVGPSDLSLAIDSSRLDPDGERTESAVRTIAQKASQAGKATAIYAATAETARRYAAMGYDLICVASDIALLRDASRRIVETIRAP